MSRLVVIGSVIGDQMMTVPHLPERGGGLPKVWLTPRPHDS